MLQSMALVIALMGSFQSSYRPQYGPVVARHGPLSAVVLYYPIIEPVVALPVVYVALPVQSYYTLSSRIPAFVPRHIFRRHRSCR